MAHLACKWDQYGVNPKKETNFFVEITKADHKLSKIHYHVLAQLQIFFYFVWFFAKNRSFPAIKDVVHFLEPNGAAILRQIQGKGELWQKVVKICT